MTDFLLVGGDSGAWVIDNASGRVCAHVLAWSARNNIAYIAPMEILLNDMTHVLGADVTLPGSSEGEDCTVAFAEAPKASALRHLGDSDQNSLPRRSLLASRPQEQPSPQRSLRSESAQSYLDNHDSDVNSSPQEAFKSYQNPYPTPSPSPPVATSPSCHPLIDNVILQQSPSADSLHHVTTTSAGSSRSEIPGRGAQGLGAQGRGAQGGGVARGRGRGKERGRGFEMDGMRTGGGVETRG